MGITTPKTKIICTIGPASDAPDEVIRELIASGMRVASLDSSHGPLGDHEQKIMRRLSLFCEIYARLIRYTDDTIEIVAKRSVDAGDLSQGDLVVTTVGQPVWVAGMTNMIRVKRCG